MTAKKGIDLHQEKSTKIQEKIFFESVFGTIARQAGFSIDKTVVERMSSIARPETLRKNDYVIKSGDHSRDVSVVKSGVFRLFYRRPNFDEVVCAFCSQGELATAFSTVVLKTPARVNVQAMTDAEVICFNYEDLCNLFPTVEWQILIRKLVELHYCYKTEREFELLSLDGTQRFKKFKQEYAKVMNQIPLKYLAQYLNVSPEYLSRMRRKL